MKKIVVWGIIGCLIFVFGFLAGSFWSTVRFFGAFPKADLGIGTSDKSIGSFDRSSSFYGNVFWGGSFKRMEEMEPLPQGDATLKVRFSYDQKPAAGVGFLLALNGKHRTALLTTDTNGEAKISLPFGQWELNRLECRSWAAQPQGEFLLVSGDESKLGASPLYELFFSFGHEGRPLLLSKDNSIQTLPIEIRQQIKMIWPSPDEPKQRASIADSKIQWEPYPQAASYVIQINQVTHESARSTTYSPIIYKQVDNVSAIALAQLPNVKSDATPNEYAIEIRAYAQDGSFLSEVEHSFSTFTLTDDHILVEYDESKGMSLDSDGVERRFQAQKTLDAAALLINKEMFQEARTLLGQTTDALVLPEQLAMLNGYLYAAQGRCEEANKYFQEALSLGQKCIPERFRERCKTDPAE